MRRRHCDRTLPTPGSKATPRSIPSDPITAGPHSAEYRLSQSRRERRSSLGPSVFSLRMYVCKLSMGFSHGAKKIIMTIHRPFSGEQGRELQWHQRQAPSSQMTGRLRLCHIDQCLSGTRRQPSTSRPIALRLEKCGSEGAIQAGIVVEVRSLFYGI